MSGYSWFRANNNAAWHPKFALLDGELEEVNTLAYVFRGWCWISAFAARGEWAPDLDKSFEDACGWHGAKGELVSAMAYVGLIDVHTDEVREMHDWWELQGKAVEKSEKDARVKRENRAKKSGRPPAEPKKKRAKAARAAHAPGASTAPLRDETLRDETIKDSLPLSPSQTAPHDTAAQGETLAQVRASAWLMWAIFNGAIEKPGQVAHTRTIYWFQKYAGDDEELAAQLAGQLKLAWKDFLEWCKAEGHSPGWGLWLEEAVGQYRLDQARAGELPRKPYAEQKTMPLGVLGRVRG